MHNRTTGACRRTRKERIREKKEETGERKERLVLLTLQHCESTSLEESQGGEGDQ